MLLYKLHVPPVVPEALSVIVQGFTPEKSVIHAKKIEFAVPFVMNHESGIVPIPQSPSDSPDVNGDVVEHPETLCTTIDIYVPPVDLFPVTDVIDGDAFARYQIEATTPGAPGFSFVSRAFVHPDEPRLSVTLELTVVGFPSTKQQTSNSPDDGVIDALTVDDAELPFAAPVIAIEPPPPPDGNQNGLISIPLI